MEKIFLLKIVKIDICLGVASKQMSLFQKNVSKKNALMPPMSRIGPDRLDTKSTKSNFTEVNLLSDMLCNGFFGSAMYFQDC